MKISSQIIGISIVLWFGLGAGLANAATSIATSLGSAANATATKGSDPAVLFNLSYTAVDYPDSANTVTAALITTDAAPFYHSAKQIPAENASIQSLGSKSRAADRMADAESSAQISPHQTYAMLLVGLGMLFFSARQRNKAV